MHLIMLLESLYSNQTAVVKTELGETEEFRLCKGVRQGCILSPILFNIYAERIIRDIFDDWHGGISFGGRKVTNLRYADDTTILASSKRELSRGLSMIKTASEAAGLFLNLKKTKVMTTGCMSNFDLQGENIEVVNSFTFLGAKIESSGQHEDEIRRRIAMGRSATLRLAKIWKDRGISVQTKTRLVQTLVFPIVLYGAETWIVRKADLKRIDAFELWCWRRMLRIPWTARRTNQWVLSKLTTRPLQTKVVTSALRYFGHTCRRFSSLEKDVMFGHREGTRRRGRPRKSWLKTLQEATGLTLDHMRTAAADREEWKRIQGVIAESRTRLDGTR